MTKLFSIWSSINQVHEYTAPVLLSPLSLRSTNIHCFFFSVVAVNGVFQSLYARLWSYSHTTQGGQAISAMFI